MCSSDLSILALSVFASQSHLSQRERLWQYGKPSGFAKGSPFGTDFPRPGENGEAKKGSAGASAPERASHVKFKENNKL